MKKILLIATVLALTLGASSLAADTNWEGTFWGDHSGVWNGTLYGDPSTESPRFEGRWSSVESDAHGKLYATLYTGGPGYYRTTTGIIYDEEGNNIGSWIGTFNENVEIGDADGVWHLTDATISGEWSGQFQEP